MSIDIQDFEKLASYGMASTENQECLKKKVLNEVIKVIQRSVNLEPLPKELVFWKNKLAVISSAKTHTELQLETLCYEQAKKSGRSARASFPDSILPLDTTDLRRFQKTGKTIGVKVGGSQTVVLALDTSDEELQIKHVRQLLQNQNEFLIKRCPFFDKDNFNIILMGYPLDENVFVKTKDIEVFELY